jgi:hypothetical protein
VKPLAVQFLCNSALTRSGLSSQLEKLGAIFLDGRWSSVDTSPLPPSRSLAQNAITAASNTASAVSEASFGDEKTIMSGEWARARTHMSDECRHSIDPARVRTLREE